MSPIDYVAGDPRSNRERMPTASPPHRRTDPGRRDRIIDACLDVIAVFGVAGTSHRKVADVAGVPLGSMTYHFTGMHELLHDAFTRFAEGVSARFEQRMSGAATAPSAALALDASINDDLLSTQRDLVLTQELYTLAAREPAFRVITNAWMARSRRTLEQFFDPTTARILDALVEGLTLHRALDNTPHDRRIAIAAITTVTGLDLSAAPTRLESGIPHER